MICYEQFPWLALALILFPSWVRHLALAASPPIKVFATWFSSLFLYAQCFCQIHRRSSLVSSPSGHKPPLDFDSYQLCCQKTTDPSCRAAPSYGSRGEHCRTSNNLIIMQQLKRQMAIEVIKSQMILLSRGGDHVQHRLGQGRRQRGHAGAWSP